MDAAVSIELEHIWPRIQADLAGSVDASTYRIWLEPLRAREFIDGRLVIEAPPQARRWIRDRFGRLLRASVEKVLGPDVDVELIASGSDPERVRDSGPGTHPVSRPGPLGNPKLTFDQFVIGDCNRLAHAAALTVAEMPGHAYNPLFICGPPGVGKTHLLSSIATLLLAHNPGLTVRCTTGEAFTNEFLGALGGGRTEDFKGRFRHIDVLLLDDVQFLERKAKTEEEFFHTFNALHDEGRQIVLTSDRPPHDLQALEDRLRERFEAGLVADIQAPGLATRLAILRKRAHQDGVVPADELALNVIAKRIGGNVRALEGALIRVVAFSSLTGRPLTGRAGRGGSQHPLPAYGPCRRMPVGRRDPGRRRCALRPLARGAPLKHPHGPHRLAAPGGDVPLTRAHSRVIALDRQALRRARPYDRPARLAAYRRPHRCRQRCQSRRGEAPPDAPIELVLNTPERPPTA